MVSIAKIPGIFVTSDTCFVKATGLSFIVYWRQKFPTAAKMEIYKT